MNKKSVSIFLMLVVLAAVMPENAFAATVDLYVSPTGSDSNACTLTSPCKTIQRGLNLVQPGGTLHILQGAYSESLTFSKAGTQTQPIRIVGEGAVLSNGGQQAIIISNSQWVTFEGLTIKGYTLYDIEIRQSHYLTFRSNTLEYTTAGILIKDNSSHILIENNDIYQSYPAGSTWSSLKGSKYEGGGVYASSGGQGMYYIRGNKFHDSMNGVYITDDSIGQWMNANVFISGNTFTNIVDDPFEPEGDSFNIHFYNNTLVNTHRLASLVPDKTCLGPIFVYGNYQRNTTDPTGEAATGRRNSALKLDMSSSACPNGVYIFNNTINANVSGTNFYGVDLITSSVKNYQLLNNVFVTERNVYSGTPTFTNAVSDYNIAIKPFGSTEPHSLLADPMLTANGTLSSTSPAKGRGTAVNIPTYFLSSSIVPGGADLGAFRIFTQPQYVSPPGGEPSSFPVNVQDWPNINVIPAAPTLTATYTATPVILPSSTAVAPQTSTPVPASTNTQMVLPTLTSTNTQVVPPTATTTALPTFTSTASQPAFTSTTVPVSTSTSQPAFTPTSFPTYTAVPPLPTSTAKPTSTTQPTPTTQSSQPRDQKIYDDNNSALIYSGVWQDVQRNKAYGKSFKLTSKQGSSVLLVFTGQSVSLIYTTGSNYGRMDVYIDNVLVGTVNQTITDNKFQQRWDYHGTLTPGQHELKLVFAGPKRSKVSIDAIIIN